MRDIERVRYWLEDGDWTPAVRVGDTVVVNLDTKEGRKVIGKQGWFSEDYVRHWNLLVPEHCSRGNEPGCWSSIPAEEASDGD